MPSCKVNIGKNQIEEPASNNNESGLSFDFKKSYLSEHGGGDLAPTPRPPNTDIPTGSGTGAGDTVVDPDKLAVSPALDNDATIVLLSVKEPSPRNVADEFGTSNDIVLADEAGVTKRLFCS